MSYCAAIGVDVNSRVAPGLEALRWHLLDVHYSSHATDQICRHVAAEGTLAGAPGLEPEDEAGAEAAYVGALPAVGFDDPEWGSSDDLDGLDIPPISGGAPVEDRPLRSHDGGFEPSAEDLADYHAWSEELERRRASMSRLERFNLERQDWSEVPA